MKAKYKVVPKKNYGFDAEYHPIAYHLYRKNKWIGWTYIGKFFKQKIAETAIVIDKRNPFTKFEAETIYYT